MGHRGFVGKTVPLWARQEGGRSGGRGEGQEEASWVLVMAFQGKLRRRELFGSASVQRWPFFAQVVNASSPSHSRHNSFSSQSASQHRLSDCHRPWFITQVPTTVIRSLPFCKVTTRPLFCPPDPLFDFHYLQQAYLLRLCGDAQTDTLKVDDLLEPFKVTFLWL